ncbi:MAG TPA: hypothetical protein VG733_16490 [Chthoniobacteraceae bacterium]|nr:hypothetical protein [Chthoniobacteraceae bacterium]
MFSPETDPYWSDTLAFARMHIGPSDSVYAEDSLLRFFPQAKPYLFMTKRGVVGGDWIIFHKGYTHRFDPRIMKDVQANYRAVFANEVFVVFLNNRSSAAARPAPESPGGTFHPAHVQALWEAVVDVPMKDDLFDQLAVAYDPPPPSKQAVKNVMDFLFSPKVIVCRPKMAGGFFANFKRVMSHLVHSLHRDGVRAVRAEWGVSDMPAPGPAEGSNFPYGTPADGNLWNHFFEPIPLASKPGWPEVETTALGHARISGMHVHFLYKSDEAWRRKYHAAYRKYIRLRPHIEAKVQEFHARHMAGRRVIGVHVRNLAHQIEYINGKGVGFETYASRIQAEIAGCKSDWAIFLATDVEEAVARFRKEFGDRVLVQPGVSRLLEKQTGDNRQQFHHQNPNPGLKLGEEVLIDCLLLSKCDALIHTVSNLATTAGYMNPRMKMIYCE